MKITLEYRNPTPAHCDVAVFINGGLVGTLTLRQNEIASFNQIVSNGCSDGIDQFLSRGNPDPSDSAIRKGPTP